MAKRSMFACAIVIACAQSGELVAQESQTQQSPALPKEAAAATPALPKIPFLVLRTSTDSPESREKLGITPEQQAKLQQVVGAHSRSTLHLNRFKSLHDPSCYRLSRAIAELIQEEDDQARDQMEAILSPAQLAQIRQARRQDIHRELGRSMPRLSSMNVASIEVYLNNEDLLSVLEQPAVQQRLKIDDSQWQRIETVRAEALIAARDVVRRYTQIATPIMRNNALEAAHDQFRKETIELLTPDQRAGYEEILTEARKQMSMPAGSPEKARDRWRLILPHGAAARSSTRIINGVAQYDVDLHNAFLEPEIRDKVKLTAEQHEEIALRLKSHREVVLRLQAEHGERVRQAEREVDEQKRQLLLDHNREYTAKLAGLLTAEQEELLQKERWKSMGLTALLKPEIVEQLELTDEQQKLIKEKLRTSVSFSSTGYTIPPPPEEFRKLAEQRTREIREGITAKNRAVWSQLTEPQRQKFIALTGYQPPAEVAASRPRTDPDATK